MRGRSSEQDACCSCGCHHHTGCRKPRQSQKTAPSYPRSGTFWRWVGAREDRQILPGCLDLPSCSLPVDSACHASTEQAWLKSLSTVASLCLRPVTGEQRSWTATYSGATDEVATRPIDFAPVGSCFNRVNCIAEPFRASSKTSVLLRKKR